MEGLRPVGVRRKGISFEALKLSLWKKYEHNRDAYTADKCEFVKECMENWTTGDMDRMKRYKNRCIEETGMIEVLFGESEAASMKAAKNREVICLGFMLDVGNIKEPVDSPYRKSLIDSMCARDCSGERLRLKKYLEDGKPIRIWYSDAPYSRCGFYSLCRMLQNYKNEVHTVKLPEYVVRRNSIISYRNWGEVSTEEFAGFLSQEKILTKEEVKMYAILWSELTEDNSPLRAVINGRVIGVPADFYDFLIWKRLGCRPIKEARLIGDILGCFQPGVGDGWFAERIDHYIQRGEIRVIEDSENKYARTIQRAVNHMDESDEMAKTLENGNGFLKRRKFE